MTKVALGSSRLVAALALGLVSGCGDGQPRANAPNEAMRNTVARAAIVAVIDRAPAMSGIPMEEAKQSLLSVARFLGPRDEIGVVLPDPEPIVLVPLGSSTSAALQRVSEIVPKYRGDVVGGMEAGLTELLRSTAGRRALVVVTDSLSARPEGVAALHRRARASQAEVIVFFLGSDRYARVFEAVGPQQLHVLEDPEALGPRLADEVRRLLGRR